MRWWTAALLVALAAFTAGCVDGPSTGQAALADTVVSQDDLGPAFNLTQETDADASDYTDSSIVRRVDRQFMREPNRSVRVFSSATVYTNASAAERVHADFTARTPGTVETVMVDGANVTKMAWRDVTIPAYVVTFSRQDGDTIYFVSVGDQDAWPDDMARSLFQAMHTRRP